LTPVVNAYAMLARGTSKEVLLVPRAGLRFPSVAEVQKLRRALAIHGVPVR
jgi:hypothetical protein